MSPRFYGLLVLITAVLLIAFSTVARPVRADNPPTDNRINRSPWVNSWGAIAVYCLNGANQAGGSYSGGGILILNSSGQRVLFAPESALNNASQRASQRNTTVVAFRQSVYILSARPGGYFVVSSAPDAEGKTFLGEFQNCGEVGSESTLVPPTGLACVARPVRNESNAGASCDLCYNGIDDDCNGKTDAQDYACQYYCFR